MKTLDTRTILVLLSLLPACGGSTAKNDGASGGNGGAGGSASLADGSTVDGKPAGGSTADGKLADGSTMDGKPMDGAQADASMTSGDALLVDRNGNDARLADAALVDVQRVEAGTCSQLPVVLGAAAQFGVLAGSTVTNTGTTTVTGDLGVSPGAAIDGFPPGAVVGNQHAGDPTAAQGIADLTTAYNDAAGRTLCPVTVAGNLGGQTLRPGLYKSTSSLEISSGDLTLDAQGDPNAVFIFQMASTLTTSAGRLVVLSGSAKAANVFWQVGTSATLGSTSAFQGTVMADQAITLSTGATLNGRALARIAAVNLDSNIIVNPTH